MSPQRHCCHSEPEGEESMSRPLSRILSRTEGRDLERELGRDLNKIPHKCSGRLRRISLSGRNDRMRFGSEMTGEGPGSR